MIYRSYSLLSVVGSKLNYYHLDQLYFLQISLAKRHASIYIKQCKTCYQVQLKKNVWKIFNTKKTGNNLDSRWTSIEGRRSMSDDKSSQNEEIPKLVKKINDTLKEKIIEIDGKELGKLKERLLSKPTPSDTLLESNKNIQASIIDAALRNNASKTTEGEVLSKKVKRLRVDHSASSLERNFITPVRAMLDFMLKPSDLESLPKTKRRSPYEDKPPITVYWRKDIEAKAIEVWGSREALLKERLKREVEQKVYQQNLFTVKRRLKDYRKEIKNQSVRIDEREGLFGRSGKVVLTAVTINACNFLCKLFAWLYTGSHSMFSECIHSAADTANQLILAYGIHKSVQDPNADHPYGYTNMKYVSSLISGVGIFCVGTGLSLYHGIHGILFPVPVESFYWAYFILGGSLISEGATLLVAINSIKKGAEDKNKPFKDYVLSGQDPSVNVVLMEDFAAVIGLAIAGSCMGLTSYLGNPIYDAVGSLLVGGLLGGVASFIIYTNVAALVGRSIPQENLDKINAELEADVMVRAIYDVKGIDMGNNLVRYKAEIDFDGRELTRSYLDKHDLTAMLDEVKKMQSIDELETFLLKHGENIVDMLGAEIDRIEIKLKKNHPEIRHCDLEVL
ncbi:zinc transporter 9 [Chelonus insularis]|uniref:zinc transporter 9 n=1 Tax=Chelonus insularis TaxID=460826 RepID=UPI001588589B|nr:zinc transporter 9 [Chelonus insularis]XP_034938172.1 zinc transporter 9 [Chelonus insularis]